MGSPEAEEERGSNEGPQHEVLITRSFALGRYAVTFDEFDHFCDVSGRDKPKDSGWGRGRCPVINVTHDEALRYCAWLGEMTGGRYQLPTEAMWEYACRATTTTTFGFGDNITTDQVNYDGYHPYAGALPGTFRRQTVAVGELPPNRWGLFEMHGNVWEWCEDGPRTYRPIRETDPLGPTTPDSMRVLRGGAWYGYARDTRAACRFADDPGSRFNYVGFRCAGVQES